MHPHDPSNLAHPSSIPFPHPSLHFRLQELPELREPSKKDIKAAKKAAADRRKAAKHGREEGEDQDGADATTDDELEAAGFMCQ
jgi:hypothetical protein